MLCLNRLVSIVILAVCLTSIWCIRHYEQTLIITRHFDGDNWSVESEEECLKYYVKAKPVNDSHGNSRCKCPYDYPHFYGDPVNASYGCYRDEQIISGNCNFILKFSILYLFLFSDLLNFLLVF